MHMGRNSSDHIFLRAVEDVTVAVLSGLVCPSQPVGIEFRGLLRIRTIQIGPTQRANFSKILKAAMLAGLKDAEVSAGGILKDGEPSDIGDIRGRHHLLSPQLDCSCRRRIRAHYLYIWHEMRRDVSLDLILHKVIRATDVLPTHPENRVCHVRTHRHIFAGPSQQA